MLNQTEDLLSSQEATLKVDEPTQDLVIEQPLSLKKLSKKHSEPIEIAFQNEASRE